MSVGERARIIVLGDNDAEVKNFAVLFNPTEYSISYHVSYQDTPISGTDQIVTQFLHGNPSTLTVELLFDTSGKKYVDEIIESEDVTEKVNEFIDLVYVKSSLHRPPRIKFLWGALIYLGTVIDIETNFTEFEQSGKPVRASLKVSIKEFIAITQSQRKTPFESPDRTKVRQIKEGNSLWNIAYEEYGTMSMWKIIAEANNVVNPFDFAIGDYIKVPAL